MTREDREVAEFTAAAEYLDQLFERVERPSDAPHCPKHPNEIVYTTGGCGRCWLIKQDEKRDRRAARYRARNMVRTKP